MKKSTIIAGVDEAGRGAWAGPIVAAAVVLPDKYNFQPIDSKKLSARQREILFSKITINSVAWSVGLIEAGHIDNRGIQNANHQVMIQAISKLKIRPDLIYVDALKIKYGTTPVKAIIRGDSKIDAIAAASIIAKVIRDTIMSGHHRLLPHWDFHQHKGYGTEEHHRLLNLSGMSPIHRRSFTPMNLM
ncbi:ribonuclease HII [Patescibacteria group bacterium]